MSVAALRDALGALQVHDVSPVIAPDMAMWFMYERPELVALLRHEEVGAAANRISLAEHTGTHVDAPFHFDPEGLTMERVPLDALLLRPYCKYDLSGEGLEPGDVVGPDQLEAAEARAGLQPEPGGVAIMEFGWDANLPGEANGRPAGWWGANEPGLSQEACELLVQRGYGAIACDTAACDVAAKDGEIVSAHGHAGAFLPRGILIVEGLRGLGGVPATGLFLALPLKIGGGTGSPLRVVLLTG
jgi:arylformamidase